MSITVLLSALALIAVLGLVVAIFIGGGVYVGRLRRKGTETVLSDARKVRELRD
ncbi:hypothetical protein [Nocardiopsis sp. NRRL B-16309]|uniref:hypothetical protein n=1 Tax=Nocardiopsis sp. NRRL B-16309 TaxID=1519494 RepID=UPI000B140193|nr:hypothetical protein [Nocardiopsis sp. NRRL B-16309]